MRHPNRTRFRWVGAVAAIAVVTAPVAALAQPADGAPPADDSRTSEVVAHDSLDGALVAAGTTREGFRSDSALAERLAAASEEYAARFPAAFAGVRIDGGAGQVAVVRDGHDADALAADARARGFVVLAAPAAARDLDDTAGRVQAWAASLPTEQREAITPVDVDPLSGDVTVLVDGSPAAPVPPADLGTGVRAAGFLPAQGSLGSAAPPDAPPVTPPPSPPAPGSMAGGTRVLITSPAGDIANWCSLGFNGLRGGRVVNITAAHCSTFPDRVTSRTVFRPGTVSEGPSSPRLGAFTAAEVDEGLDAALVSIDPAAETRFRNSHVLAADAQPLALSGSQRPVVGQLLCKYGQRTGYTCGKVSGVDSASPGGTTNVEVDLCAIAGDSGGVVFSSTRAVAVTSLSNAFDQYGVPYEDCATARDALARWRTVPMIVGVTVGAIENRFPGLQVGAS